MSAGSACPSPPGTCCEKQGTKGSRAIESPGFNNSAPTSCVPEPQLIVFLIDCLLIEKRRPDEPIPELHQDVPARIAKRAQITRIDLV